MAAVTGEIGSTVVAPAAPGVPRPTSATFGCAPEAVDAVVVGAARTMDEGGDGLQKEVARLQRH